MYQGKIIEETGLNCLHYLHYPAAQVRKVARYAVNLTLRFWHHKRSQEFTQKQALP